MAGFFVVRRRRLIPAECVRQIESRAMERLRAALIDNQDGNCPAFF
jgi:DNA-directed RNA polymerase sigma subunit (sigma70/sigma32)